MLSFACVAALGGVGCKQRFTNANLEVVNREMVRSEEQLGRGGKDGGVSPKEVESILGPPSRMETHRLPLETQKKEVELTQYFYEQDGQTVELHFFDNKLIAPVPLLPEKALGAAKGP